MAENTRQRLAYIDWMRGLACVLMFQTHCYDSWLGGSARQSGFIRWSQRIGTLPAPLFLLLAGISFAFVTDRPRARGVASGEIARKTIRRGAEIFGLGLLFRAQEYALGYRWVPWTDLLRVDILNMIGLSMMVMGALCFVVESSLPRIDGTAQRAPRERLSSIAASLVVASAIALATPPLWTTHRPRWLPWFLESYINGAHIFGEPQVYLFPIFPWAAFAFAGLAVGFFLMTDWARRNEAAAVLSVGVGGAALGALALSLESLPQQLYAVHDFWHTSPNFFLVRLAVLLVILTASYAWCRWGPGLRGFSPLIQLGTTSLLVYWVHIEFVYGRFSILPKRMTGIPLATLGLITIFSAMLVVSILRTRWLARHQKSQMTPKS